MAILRRIAGATRQARGHLAWLAAFVGLGPIGIAALVAWRGARFGVLAMRPERLPVTRPADASNVPGLADVSFTTETSITLRGWYVPSRTGAAVILVHGYSQNRAAMWPEARALVRSGYGVLMFDWQAHGESGGEVCTWGDQERSNLVAALRFLEGRSDVESSRIGVFAFSMGGYTATNVAATDPRVRALVLAGVSSSLEDHDADMGPRFAPLFIAAEFWNLRRHGVDTSQTRTIDFIGRIAPRPVLIIGGGRDPAVPRARIQSLFDAAGEPKELWFIEEAAHGGYIDVLRETYERRLVAFFDRGLGVSGGG